MTYEEYIKRQNSKSSSREMANKEDSSSGANSAAAIIDVSGFVDEDYENDEFKTSGMTRGGKVSVGRADRVNATMSVDYGQSDEDVRVEDLREERRTASTIGYGAPTAQATT